MTRDKGHALRRSDEDKAVAGYRWTCECGVPFGFRSVHEARRVWREHKAALPDEVPAA